MRRASDGSTHLVLCDSSDFGVDGFYARAQVRRGTHGAGVALERTVDQRVDLPLHVTGCLRVGECLVSGRLL